MENVIQSSGPWLGYTRDSDKKEVDKMAWRGGKGKEGGGGENYHSSEIAKSDALREGLSLNS